MRCLSTWSRGDNLDAGLRPTYWTISKKLKTSPKAVKKRIEYLTEKGVLAQIGILPDVTLFGLYEGGIFAMFSKENVSKMREHLNLFDFVQMFHIFRPFQVTGEAATYDRPSDTFYVWLNVVYRKDADLGKKINLLKAIVGDFPVIRKFEYTRRRYEKVPSNKSIMVLKELCRSPNADITEIAKKLSISTRSATKYFRELLRLRAFYYLAIMDWSKLDSLVGLIVIPITDNMNGESIIKVVKEKMEENWLGYDVGSAGRKATTAWVAFSGESISKIEKFYSTLKEDDERFKNASLFLAPESVDNQANISYLIQ